jgi:hypothetical protein
MKRYIIPALLCLLAYTGIAQTAGNDLTIGVAAIDMTRELTEAQMMKLESKTMQLIDRSGQAKAGYTNEFMLKPAISVDDSKVVEGGMQQMTVTTLDVTFYLVRIGDNMVVMNTMTKKIKGSGNNQEQAISNAINNINVSDNAYKQFIAASKEKILTYYGENCRKIMNAATAAENKHDYEQAVSLLFSVPSGVPCYEQAAKKAASVYAKYRQQLCDKIITYARGQIAMENYGGALDALNLIEPGAGCSAAVNDLIAQAERKVEKRIAQEYTAEAKRIKALETIATAYYTRQARAGKRR